MQVLVVDDLPSQRSIYRNLLETMPGEIQVTDFGDPVAALLWSQKHTPDLVVLDYRMPKMDGLEFVRRFRRPLSQRDIPIMLLTVVDEASTKQAALDSGVLDYVIKPIVSQEFRARCKNLLEIRQQQLALKWRANSLQQVLRSGMDQQRFNQYEMIVMLQNLLQQREQQHLPTNQTRLSMVCELLAHAVGMPEEQIKTLSLVAPLHDLGNIGVPDSILFKSSVLTQDEHAQVQTHTQRGFEILAGSNAELLQMAAEVALSHHENWDGTGYPNKKRGEEIPLEARIVAIADSLEAMQSERPYRAAIDFEAAFSQVALQAGKRYDPNLVRLIVASREQLKKLYTRPDLQ
jgi:two-component system, response regulator RpfG